MCGIAGVWNAATSEPVAPEMLIRMRDALVHRGPDDSGGWTDDRNGVGLAFRRLSIIDLSPAGHQPMLDDGESVAIVFNGEIYNFRRIRAELEARGRTFRSRSDTEVILQAYCEWGDGCIERFVGMFAFVIWDRGRRRIFAARDRLGIKPLYYADGGGRLVFASELKALLEAGVSKTIDASALRSFLQHGYVSAPQCILAAVRSLPPGHTLTWAAGDSHPVVRRYWAVESFYEQGAWEGRTEDAAADVLDELLRDAVSLRLISDVPLGAFLSGGLDSALVVAMMRQVTNAGIRTYTVGFAEASHDESRHAQAVANHLGTTHKNLRVTEAEARAAVALMPGMYDEPFADSSQIPTYLISRLTRRDVTVALSGDGGDELFCGYAGYRQMASWQRAWRVPQSVRSAIAFAGRMLPLPKRLALIRDGFASQSPYAFYDFYASVWRPAEIDALAPALRDVSTPARDGVPNGAPLLDALMLRDLRDYLPNDILTKVDRASMAVSLEARVPLLDHRVVEFAQRIPLEWKLRNGVSKVLMRKVLYRYVPQALLDRPKTGFGIPLDAWLRGDLRPLLDEHLDEDRIRSQKLFSPRAVTDAVRRFLSGRSTHARVWSLLSFQAWLDRYCGGKAVLA